MYTLIAYIKHVFTSTNQHGVHSPFVYDFVTKCLYAKVKYKATKSESVLLKSIPYFSAERLKIEALDARLKNIILKKLGLETSKKPPFDIIYVDDPSANLVSIHKEQIHNNTMLLIANIHSNKNNTAIWDALKQHATVTVSIDLFYCGALFFRSEQTKEHFKIRI